MVDFIGIERVRELVARRGAQRFIAELAQEIEADFVRWDAFEKSARHASHSKVGVIELMPACDGRLYAFKYVNGHPSNTRVGLLTVTAFGVLADVETGYPLLLSELTLTTALRTAATCALAARRMARPDSRVMALIGNGAQSEFQTLAFHDMLGMREVRLFDTDAGATDKLERNLARLHLPGLKVVRCASTADAVAGADIVTTVTADKRNATILTAGDDRAGHASERRRRRLPGQDRAARRTSCAAPTCASWSSSSRSRASRAKSSRWMPPSRSPSSPRVLAGSAPGRAAAHEVTVFDSVGFALEDFSSLRYLHARAPGGARHPAPDRPGAGPGRSEGSVRAAGGRARRRAAHCGARRGHGVSAVRTASLIGAPTDVGAADRGASMGPEALRVAGLDAALRGRELEVVRPAATSAARRIPGSRRTPATAICRRWCTGTSWCTRRVYERAAPRAPADSARGRSLPRASARSARSRATAASRAGGCACCGSMRTPTSTPASCPRAATCTACRSPACAGSGRAS